MTQPGLRKSAVTAAYLCTLLFALLGLASALSDPVPGVLIAAVFLAIAMGIRKGQPWAAIAGMALLTIPLFMAVLRWNDMHLSASSMEMALSIATLLGFSLILFLAARQLAGQIPLNISAGGPWILVMAASLLFWLCLRPFVMPTGSMEETLLRGDRVLVDVASPHLGRKPGRGELVTFHYPVDRNQTFIKRVVGIPGDRIRLKDGRVQLNGTPAAEPYARHRSYSSDTYRDNFPESRPGFPLFPGAASMLADHLRDGEIVIPEGQYFVLGDDRDNSLDSRYWGFVSGGDIIGRPVLIYGSNEMGEGQAGSRSIANTRWRRLLKRL